MFKRLASVLFLPMILTGCLTTSGDVASPKGKKRQSKNNNIHLIFAGDEPRDWTGFIKGRQFSLNSLSLSQNRYINWEVSQNGDRIHLTTYNKELSIEIEENACVANATHYDYRATISLDNEQFIGCAKNEGEAIEVPEDEPDEESDDASKEKKSGEGVEKSAQKGSLSVESGVKKASDSGASTTASSNRMASGAGKKSSSSNIASNIKSGTKGAALSYQIPKDATVLNITFSGTNPVWSGSLKGRAFQFTSSNDQIFENRRLSWQGKNEGGRGIISSPDGSISMIISGAECAQGGQTIDLKVAGKSFRGCATIH